MWVLLKVATVASTLLIGGAYIWYSSTQKESAHSTSAESPIILNDPVSPPTQPPEYGSIWEEQKVDLSGLIDTSAGSKGNVRSRDLFNGTKLGRIIIAKHMTTVDADVPSSGVQKPPYSEHEWDADGFEMVQGHGFTGFRMVDKSDQMGYLRDVERDYLDWPNLVKPKVRYIAGSFFVHHAQVYRPVHVGDIEKSLIELQKDLAEMQENPKEDSK